MKKKILSILITIFALCICMFSLTACGEDEKQPTSELTSEGLEYVLIDSDTHYEVRDIGTCTDVDIIIPTTYNGKPVTSIGSSAFYNCETLASIKIPNSITTIGSSAFYSCGSLTRVTIANSVTSIGEEAFSYCSSLTIYCEVESVPSGWYVDWNYSCPVVWNCNNNDVATDGYIYTVADGIRYGIKDNVATVVRQPENITTANIASSINYKGNAYNVTTIGDNAFEDCYSLASVTIGNSITSIGEQAFASKDLLTSIEIPDSVTSISEEAFFYCPALTIYCEAESQSSGWSYGWNCSLLPVVWNCNNNDVATDGYIYTVADGIRYGIKDNVATVVRQPKNITTANIPSSINYKGNVYNVTSIGDSAFEDCDLLTSIEMHDSVERIGEKAFFSCDSLTSIVIPNSVTWIGRQSFYICSSLTSVTIGTSLTTGISTSIDKQAFYSCNKLVSVTMGNNVKSIGEQAFYWCSSLTTINYRGGEGQWLKINKGFRWDYKAGSYTIVYNYTGT